jgi:hypothetical protein
MIKPRTPKKTVPRPTPKKPPVAIPIRQKPIDRPKPTGPDYEGPYSIKGTAGPVSEKVSKVRDIINETSSPIPYQKKGGATKAAYKKGGTVKAAAKKKTIVKSKKK